MPNTKTARQWPQLLVLLSLIAVGGWLWLNYQYALDSAKAWLYEPSSEMAAIAQEAQLNESGEFLFYASQPTLLSSDKFNEACKRREATSPILGCYNGQQIHLFDVTDERLEGIEEVTAAHEMLHVAWERLPENSQNQLTPLLRNEFEEHATPELEERMAYYERNEPGEELNELHSIIGTEISDLTPELEEHYERYFRDRVQLVNLHQSVEARFNQLAAEADELVRQIDELSVSINAQTEQFNSDSRQLNQDIQAFNQRARQPGGFSSQATFEQERSLLQARSSQLQAKRTAIQSDIGRYNSLIEQLEAVNAESASLYQGIDSTLEQAPTV